MSSALPHPVRQHAGPVAEPHTPPAHPLAGPVAEPHTPPVPPVPSEEPNTDHAGTSSTFGTVDGNITELDISDFVSLPCSTPELLGIPSPCVPSPVLPVFTADIIGKKRNMEIKDSPCKRFRISQNLSAEEQEAAAHKILNDMFVLEPELISPQEFGKKCFHEKYSLEEFESERDKLLVRWEEFKQTGKGWNPRLAKSFPIFDGHAPAGHPYPQAFKGEDFLVKKRAYDRAKAELLVSLDTHARHTLLTYANASAGEQGVLYDEMAWTNIVNAYPSLPEWDFEYREVFEAMQDIGMFPSHLDYEAKPNNHMVNNVYLARMALAVQYTEEDVAHAKRLLNAM